MLSNLPNIWTPRRCLWLPGMRFANPIGSLGVCADCCEEPEECGCDDPDDVDGGFTLVVNSTYGIVESSGTYQLAPIASCTWGQVVSCMSTGVDRKCFLIEATIGSEMDGSPIVEVKLWDMRLWDDSGTVRHVAEYPFTLFRKVYEGEGPISCSSIELDEYDPVTGNARAGDATLTATSMKTYDPEQYQYDYLYLLPYEAPGCVPNQIAVALNFTGGGAMSGFSGAWMLDKVVDSRPKWELAFSYNGFDCILRLEVSGGGLEFTFWVKCGTGNWWMAVYIYLDETTTPAVDLSTDWMTISAECNYSDGGTSWFRNGPADCFGADFSSPWSGYEDILIAAGSECG